ncbi:MAG: tetratricopeptide repeat protein [Gemmatimonadota bacterium]
MAWWDAFRRRLGSAEPKPDYYAEGVELAGEERFHEALTSFRLALRERPGDVATLEQMAIVYTRMGMTDEAIKMYQRALDKRPGSAGAHYGIAFLLLNRGREDEAADHLRAFLQVGAGTAGSERHVQHAQETLKELQSSGAPDESAADAD